MRRAHHQPLPQLGQAITLTEHASHHLIHVCRLGAGDRVVLFDGLGRQCEAEILVGSVPADVRGITDIVEVRASVSVHLILGLPKGPAADLAVRMATEAGVRTIHPVWATRTQGRHNKLDRWIRTATAAAAQCGRADLPTIHPPCTLTEVVERLDGIPILLASPDATERPARATEVAVCIGPEGGWTPQEQDTLLQVGAHSINLGPFVLRTETAAAVAVALLTAGFGTPNEKGPPPKERPPHP